MRSVWTSGLLAVALLAGLAWYLSPLEPGVVALQFAFTPSAFGEIIHFWSPEDLLRYRRHLPVDFLLLATYGAFGYLLVTRTSLFGSRSQPLRRAASWVLPVAALFDATENALHWWLTEVPRFGVPLVYAASASFSFLKWALIVGFGLLVAYALSRVDA
jgi:hypothetical protein